MIILFIQKDLRMIDVPSPRTRRSAVSPTACSLRLQRIVARLQRRLGKHRGREEQWGGGKAAAAKNLEKHHLGVWRLATL
jgi:hypothetical protein